MPKPTWGVAPNGFVEVPHEYITLVCLKEGILPLLGGYILESIVVEDPKSWLVGKLQSKFQKGPFSVCKKQGTLIAILEHGEVHCVAD